MTSHIVVNKQNVGAVARSVANSGFAGCNDIVNIMKASVAKRMVIGVLVVSKTNGSLNALAYCTISDIHDYSGFNYVAVHKICTNTADDGSVVKLLKYFEADVVPKLVDVSNVQIYTIILNANDANDGRLYDLLMSRNYILMQRVKRASLCKFLINIDPRPICDPNYQHLTNPISQLEQQHEAFYTANEVNTQANSDRLGNMKWKYETIDDKFTLGFLELSGYSDFQCFVANVFVQAFSNSCDFIGEQFQTMCASGHDVLLFVLLIKPAVIAPEEQYETYSFGPGFTAIDAQKVLKAIDAPITRGLVGVSFILGQVYRIPNTNLGYYYSDYVSRCHEMAKKYEQDLPIGADGKRRNITALLLDRAEQIGRGYGINVMGLDEVPFAVLTSVQTAYFLYLNKAGYTQITEPTEILNCEAFGYGTARPPTIGRAINERGESINVPQMCDHTFIMYKPLVQQM